MYKKLVNIQFLTFGLLFLAIPFFSYAQSFGSAPAPVQYIVAPEIPGPNTLVSIEVQGVGSFLGDANISWSVNGKTTLSGVGARQFSFTTGTLGKTTTVSVFIQSSQYGTITKTFTFNPSRINLTWEAQTTAPILYRGRSLWSSGSGIKVIAFPEVMKGGSSVPASSLSYQWKLDGEAQVADSGTGQNMFSFNGNLLRSSATVSVDVYSGTSAVGHADITIPMSNPLLLLYENDPLRGIRYSRALSGSFTMTAQEDTLRAEPYFFGAGALSRGSLQYLWQINGQDTQGPQSAQGELTLRRTGSGGGTAGLSVSLQNLSSTQLLQQAQATLSIIFGQDSMQSTFGI